MRLNGWVRIGIILSIVWMVGGTGYYEAQNNREDQEYAQAVYNGRSTCIGENAQRQYRGEPKMSCDVYNVDEAFKRRPPLWFAAIIPTFWLVVAWVLIGVTYVAVRWIRKGFAAP
jgi:hypothetical protein